MMLLGLHLVSPVKFQRAACIACMPFVFAFIAFNLLDLDGSNLLALTRSARWSIVDADIGISPRIDPLPEQVQRFDNEQTLPPNHLPDQARWKIAELRALSRLEKARTHLYHVSLPRDSVPG